MSQVNKNYANHHPTEQKWLLRTCLLASWHVSTVLGTLQQKSPMPRANGALCQQVCVAAKHTCILSMLEA